MAQHHGKRAAISWTGGKDSALAFYEAKLYGFEVVGFVTFTPVEAKFLAHPLELMKMQSEAIGIPHYFIEIKSPFRQSYVEAINFLKKKYKIETIITGDIAEIGSCTNWMQECSSGTGVDILRPLWHRDRSEIMSKLIDSKFEVIFSGVKSPWFDKDFVGKKLDTDSLSKLENLHSTKDLDICGENGEYHTQVLDAPFFKKNIKIDTYSTKEKDDLFYIDIKKLMLVGK